MVFFFVIYIYIRIIVTDRVNDNYRNKKCVCVPTRRNKSAPYTFFPYGGRKTNNNFLYDGKRNSTLVRVVYVLCYDATLLSGSR